MIVRITPRLFQLSACVATLTLLASFFAQPALAQKRYKGDFVPGDAVRITVWQDPGIEGADVSQLGIADDYLIDRAGYIFMPLIGRLRIVGHTSIELADLLAERYKKYMSGLNFVCTPLIRLNILGAVNKPGSYLLEEDATLWEAIGLADGPAPGVNLDEIALLRGGEVVAEKLLSQYENAYSLKEIGVRSGDQLRLPFRGTLFLRALVDYGSFFISAALLIIQIRRETNR